MCRVFKIIKDDWMISLGIKKMGIRKVKFRLVWEDYLWIGLCFIRVRLKVE